VIPVINVQCSKSKFIQASLPYNSSSSEIHVAKLLYLVVLLRVLDLVAGPFDVRPASLNVECVVERKFFVHHSEAVVGPHVVKPMSGEFARPVIQVTVRHMTVTEYCTALRNVLLHKWNNMVHAFVLNAVDQLDLGASTVHPEHPPDDDCTSLAMKLLVIYLAFVNFDRSG
jgi:hypothetical protein